MSYIDAVASQAGYQVIEPRVDHDSVDGIIMADFGQKPRIDFQAKATELDILRGSNLHYPLPVKNYHDLRVVTRTPRILIVVWSPARSNSGLARQKMSFVCVAAPTGLV